MAVRIGILGKRGGGLAAGLRSVDGAAVTAVADADPAAREALRTDLGVDQAFDGLEPMLDAVDAVVVATPMHLHVPHAVAALAAGKHVLSEVTAAVSMDECWRLRDAVLGSNRTYMLAENYCYGEEPVIVEELVRRGAFGRPTFGEGEYVHEVRFLLRQTDGSPTWRAVWQAGLRGNTYITHELGPVMRWFRAADPGVRIVSAACFGTGPQTDPDFPADDTSLTLIRLSNGALIKIRLDLMSNRPEMIAYSLQGTLGVYESGRGRGTDARVWFGGNESVAWGDPPRVWRPLREFEDCLPADYRAAREEARKTGHGGGDFHCGRRFAEAVVRGTAPDIGIFDALEWTAAGLASQISAEQGGAVVPVPDFRSAAARPRPLDPAFEAHAAPPPPAVRLHSPPQLRMRRPNLDGLPPLAVADGYEVRAFRLGDEASAAATLTAAFGMEWTPDRVRSELAENPFVRRMFVVVHPNDGVVATASAAWRASAPEEGYVHWVATHPDHAGRRLGWSATLAVLHDFVRQGLRPAMLETDDHRLPAIRVYRDLGFAPDPWHPSHPSRWAAVDSARRG